MKAQVESPTLQSFAVCGTHWYIHSGGLFWNKIYYPFKDPGFSQWIISEILKLWGSIFLKKCPKFYIDSKKELKYP